MSAAEHESSPQQRVILLGASNLTRGISTVVELTQQIWGGPLDIMAALGHGRSLGMRSSVLGRTLPGILQCELWNELADRPPLPTAALLTDIGNDLIYEQEVETVVGWLEECLDRLARHNARIVLTQLPLSVIPRVKKWQYLAVRTVNFPRSRLSYEDVIARAHELNEHLVRLAAERKIPTVVPPAKWYGFDPIHIQLKHWPTAWMKILARWRPGQEVLRPSGSLRRFLYLRSIVPDQRWLLGIPQRRQQPAGKLPDGSWVSYY